ncbi:MAG TPA: response regulator [Phycisphaerae bacterium]|nr:response regulator [Phycisphaerae bacterium]
MEKVALLIEHDRKIMDEVLDQIVSLGDNYKMASCLQEAQELLFEKCEKFDYIVCELNLPARVNSPVPSCENSSLLLRRIRRTSQVPVFIIADASFISRGYAVKMVKLGANDVIDYPFPSLGRSLRRAIFKTLQFFTSELQQYNLNHAPQKLESGTIYLTEEGIEINGIKICDYEELSGAGNIIVELSRLKATGRRVRLGGKKLAAIVGGSEQTVFTVVWRLRERFHARCLAENLICDPCRIIANTKHSGYYIGEEFDVVDMRGAKADKSIIMQSEHKLLLNTPELQTCDPEGYWNNNSAEIANSGRVPVLN